MLTINGIEVIPVSVDENGMDPLDLPFESRSPRLICVTPSHQYPLGSVMSLTRRQRILALAQQHNCWVVEDDYDSEFRFQAVRSPRCKG